MRATALALFPALLVPACGARTGLLVPDGGSGEGGCPIGIDEVVSATLQVTTDDQYRLWQNGKLLDETPRLWSSPQIYTVVLFRHPSRRNTIAIEGTNLYNTEGRDRGILADLRVSSGGMVRTLVTDATWRLSITLVSGWSESAFDASGWKSALSQGKHPIDPWGPVFGTSDAEWIWSYDSNLPSGAKVTRETIYVRRDFYLAVDGAIVSAPGTCP